MVWLLIWDFLSRKCILDNSQTLWNSRAGKSTSRLRFAQRQLILISHCSGSKRLRWQSQLANWWHRDRLREEQISWERYACCNLCVFIEKASRQACAFPTKSTCRRAACSKTRQIFTWRHIAHMIYEHVRAISVHEAAQGLAVQRKSTGRQCPRFRRTMGPGVTVSKWNTDGNGPGRIVQVKIAGFCATSDCIGVVWSRDYSKQWATTLSKIDGFCEATDWSDDENSKHQSPKWNSGERCRNQESKRNESLCWEESGRLLAVEGKETMLQRRLM